MKHLASYCLLIACVLSPGAAQAFSDRAVFGDDTLLGGGGGRFFTGSPIDGYSCAVCHMGGPTPQVTVFGLPVDGYEPGVAYPVELQWSEPSTSHSLALEFVNLNGLGAGMVSLPAPEQIPASGRCEQAPTGEVAAYLVASGSRRIVGVDNCKAGSVRFNFVAPVDDEIAFSATIVRSDGSETPDGDGVLELRKVLRRRGIVVTTRGSTTCVVLPGARGEFRLPLAALCCIGLLQRRRTRRARAAAR